MLDTWQPHIPTLRIFCIEQRGLKAVHLTIYTCITNIASNTTYTSTTGFERELTIRGKKLLFKEKPPLFRNMAVYIGVPARLRLIAANKIVFVHRSTDRTCAVLSAQSLTNSTRNVQNPCTNSDHEQDEKRKEEAP